MLLGSHSDKRRCEDEASTGGTEAGNSTVQSHGQTTHLYSFKKHFEQVSDACKQHFISNPRIRSTQKRGPCSWPDGLMTSRLQGQVGTEQSCLCSPGQALGLGTQPQSSGPSPRREGRAGLAWTLALRFTFVLSLLCDQSQACVPAQLHKHRPCL